MNSTWDSDCGQWDKVLRLHPLGLLDKVSVDETQFEKEMHPLIVPFKTHYVFDSFHTCLSVVAHSHQAQLGSLIIIVVVIHFI
jgi:hypothetical protein